MAAPNGKKAPMSPVVKQIAQALGEDKPMARGQIKGIVRTLGEERALAILQQALEIEEQGELMLPDGSRRHRQAGFSFGWCATRPVPTSRSRSGLSSHEPKQRRKPGKPRLAKHLSVRITRQQTSARSAARHSRLPVPVLCQVVIVQLPVRLVGVPQGMAAQ